MLTLRDWSSAVCVTALIKSFCHLSVLSARPISALCDFSGAHPYLGAKEFYSHFAALTLNLS